MPGSQPPRPQVAWFQRQIFGQKSERRIALPEGSQGSLGEDFSAIPEQSLPDKKMSCAPFTHSYWGSTIGLSFLSIETPMVPLQVHSCQRKVSP